MTSLTYQIHCSYVLDIQPIRQVHTPSIGSISNLYHIETVNYNIYPTYSFAYTKGGDLL